MTQDFNPCAMRKIYEPNASIPNYLISGLMINFKEWYLRIKAHSFRFLSFVFLGLLLLLFFNWVGILYFLCLCSLLVLDFAFMVLSYGKMALKHRSQYPEGLILEVDDEGFRKSTKTGFQ